MQVHRLKSCCQLCRSNMHGRLSARSYAWLFKSPVVVSVASTAYLSVFVCCGNGVKVLVSVVGTWTFTQVMCIHVRNDAYAVDRP